MSELSEEQPIEGRDWSRSPVPHRQCVGHKKNGERCKNAAILGGTVCKFHGGASKHVRNAARVRLANAADRLARELLKMATDDNVSDAVKLNAIRDALDRGGVGVKAEIELTAKPYETLVDQIETMQGGSRAESRRARGIPDDTPALADQPHELPAGNDEPIEAQIVDDLDDVDVGDLYGAGQPITPGDDERGSPFDTAPPNDALMTMEEGMSEIARLRGEAAQRARQEQRALPPGNSARR
ncbi:hypothetical protein DAVIS_04691 [Mycobacterium marinum]|uniref:Uncharacterized protein n=1 Tax=Mycobacterium marinum TaxID=1781 RepID=A0A3E2MQW5_MYCMR|nr:hypothetical protein [Mycobacterium marinum]RFZ35141.1 hypothetical protein DAVIS_04691 [Mycobacterium marinum]